MSGDDSQPQSELQELANEVAGAAATPIAGHRVDRGTEPRAAPPALDPPADHARHSARAFWNVTWISAATIIIALAMVAASGWIF